MTDGIQYTGMNFIAVQEFCDGKIMAPYFCMGFSMLSLMTDDGLVTIHEGDWIVKSPDGKFTIE